MDILPPEPSDFKIVYSVYPMDDPTKDGEQITQMEIKVHVAKGHKYKDKLWVENMTPEMQRLFDEMGKVATDLQAKLG